MIITKKLITQWSYDIVGCAIKVHRELGPGLLESVYQKCFEYELRKFGFDVQVQKSIPIIYDNISIDAELRYDFLINDNIVVEIKSTDLMHPIFEAQILSYMKLLKVPQGLLINFNSIILNEGVRPFVNEFFKFLPEN